LRMQHELREGEAREKFTRLPSLGLGLGLALLLIEASLPDPP
jgi:hypothetical protein